MSGSPYNPVPTVRSQGGAIPYEHLDLSPEAFGAGVGQSLQRSGQEIKQAAHQQLQTELALKRQHNETIVLDAASQASQELGTIEAEYRQLHGTNAVAQLKSYQEKIAKVGENIQAKLPDVPEIREAFHQRFQSYSDGTTRGFGLHAADQADQAYVNALEGSIGSAKSRLVRESGLGRAAPNYDELVGSVALLADKMGWEPGQAHAYLQKQSGDVIGDIVAARIAGNQLGQAQNIFEAAAKANIPGTDLPFLDADAQARISHTIHSEIKAQETLSRAENAEDAHNLAQSDVQSRMLTGKPLSAEFQGRIKAGMTPRQWDAYQADVKRADTIFKATGDMKILPTADLTGAVEKLKPVGGEEDFNDREAAYVRAATIAQNTIKLRQTDPGGAVREAFPTTVGAAWQAYEAKPTPEGLQTALKASEVAQAALGIPSLANRREGLMPVAMARTVAGNIASAAPQQQYQQLQSWATQFGPYWNKAFRQMSTLLPPAAKVAAIMPDGASAALMLETAHQDQTKLERALDLPSTGSGSISNAIATDTRMQDLRASLSQRRGGGATADAMAQSAAILARGLVQTRGQGVGPAVETAISRVIADKYRFGRVNDRPFHVQQDRDIDAIETGAVTIMQGLANGVLDLPQVPKGMTKEAADKQLAAAIKNNGYWATNDDVSGLILYSERGVPVTIGGKAVSYTWDQLQAASVKTPGRPSESVYLGVPGQVPESALER